MIAKPGWIWTVGLLVMASVSACGSGQRSGTSRAARASQLGKVELEGTSKTVPGKRVELTVTTESSDAGLEFLLELGDGRKTVWQKAPLFTLEFEQAGVYEVTAHARRGTVRDSSAKHTIEVAAPEVVLEADPPVVERGATSTVVFKANLGANAESGAVVAEKDADKELALYDDGDTAHGDDQAGDGVWSCELRRAFPQGIATFQVKQADKARSNLVHVYSYAAPDPEAIDASMAGIALIDEYLQSSAKGKKFAEVLAAFPTTFAGATQIDAVEKSDEYAVVKLRTGQVHVVSWQEDGTNAGAGDPLLPPAGSDALVVRGGGASDVASPIVSTTPTCTHPHGANGVFRILAGDDGKYRALICSPEHHEFGEDDHGAIADSILLASRQFAELEWLPDGRVSVDSMTAENGKPWADYGMIVFDGHGDSQGFWLGERVESETETRYQAEINVGLIRAETLLELSDAQRIASLKVANYWVSARWLRSVNPLAPIGTFFYAGSCYGGHTLSTLLPNPVTSGLLGFSGPVYIHESKDEAEQLFTALAVDGKSLKDIDVTKWVVDPDRETKAVPWGNQNLAFFCPKDRNGAELVVQPDDPCYACVCPPDLPHWNDTTSTCEACPAGETWDPNSQSCSNQACDKGVYDGDADPAYDAEVDALVGYTQVTGNLRVLSGSLDRLHCLATVGGNLTLKFSSWTSLTGLENLTSVGGDLTISTSSDLTSLTGLEKLASVGSLYITDNLSLKSLAGLDSLASTGTLYLEGNAALTSLSGLGSLASVGALYLEGNAALTSLAGLEHVTSLARLDIVDNSSLTSLAGLESLTSVPMVSIGDNAALTSLARLDGLKSVASLIITNNAVLTSLTGLESLKSVGVQLTISNNAKLTSLAGLENLTSVSERGETTEYLSISNNPVLPQCEVCALLDRLVAYPSFVFESNKADTCNKTCTE